MKTLILLLAVALNSPAFGQESYESSTTGTNSTTTESDPYSGSSTPMEERSLNTEESFRSGTTTTEPAMTDTTAPATETMPPAAVTPATPETTSTAYREDMGRSRIFGGFYIEPAFFGVQTNNDIRFGSANEFDSTGFGADLKLGGHINDMVFLAVDGRYERSQFTEGGLEDLNADTWNVGPTLGVQAPWFGARVWGTYILDGSNNPEQAANGVDLRFQKPYGWRGGVGVRLAAVSLNLEYEDLTYRETVVQSSGNVGNAAANTDFGNRAVAVSLSFPIQL